MPWGERGSGRRIDRNPARCSRSTVSALVLLVVPVLSMHLLLRLA